jgi:hypothetical protein
MLLNASEICCSNPSFCLPPSLARPTICDVSYGAAPHIICALRFESRQIPGNLCPTRLKPKILAGFVGASEGAAGFVPVIQVGLQPCHDPSAAWAGAHKPSAGKSRPAPVGMTRSRGSRWIGIARVVRPHWRRGRVGCVPHLRRSGFSFGCVPSPCGLG